MTSDPTTISKAVQVSLNGVTADLPVTGGLGPVMHPARPSSGTAVTGQTGTRPNPGPPLNKRHHNEQGSQIRYRRGHHSDHDLRRHGRIRDSDQDRPHAAG